MEQDKELAEVLLKQFKDIFKGTSHQDMLFISEVVYEHIDHFNIHQLFRIKKWIQKWHSAHQKQKMPLWRLSKETLDREIHEKIFKETFLHMTTLDGRDLSLYELVSIILKAKVQKNGKKE